MPGNTNTGSMGAQSRLSMADVGTSVASYTESHEIQSESLICKTPIMDNNGLRGTYAHDVSRTRPGNDEVGGDIVYTASPAIFDLVLPRVFGAAKSGNIFDFASVPYEFDCLIDRVAKRFVYGGCVIGKTTFRGRVGQFVEMVCSIRGKSETVYGTAFPTIAAPTDSPYIFADGTVTVQGVGNRKILDFECTIDWMLNVRYSNSLQVTSLMPKDRIISLGLTAPFTSSEYDMYTNTSAAAQLVLTNGGCSATFDFGAVRIDRESPQTKGKDEILLPLRGRSWANGSTPDLRITNDSTP